MCVNECPPGTDKDTYNSICIPDLKHDRKVIMAVVLFFVSLINVGVVVAIIVVHYSEKQQRRSRFSFGSKQESLGRSVEMRANVKNFQAGLVSAKKDPNDIRASYL